MDNFFLQSDAQNGLTDSINEGLFSFIDKINPFQLPHSNFVTDLAIIMILAAIVTLAFFKIRQPLIIGYLFAGMLIGPLSPLWTWFLPEEGPPSAGNHVHNGERGPINIPAKRYPMINGCLILKKARVTIAAKIIIIARSVTKFECGSWNGLILSIKLKSPSFMESVKPFCASACRKKFSI